MIFWLQSYCKVGSLLKSCIAVRGPTCFPVTSLTASLASVHSHIMQILLRKNQARPSACYLGYKKLRSVCVKCFQKRSESPLYNLRTNDIDERRLSVKIGSGQGLLQNAEVCLYIYFNAFLWPYSCLLFFSPSMHTDVFLSNLLSSIALHKHILISVGCQSFDF